MAHSAFDAIVVGSGAGGGAVAWALARAAWKVLVLEKGPHYTEEDFHHDEVAVCRRDYFVPSPWQEPQLLGWNGAVPSPTAEGWIACCVGGGTVHMSGFFFRMHPDDFRQKTLYGSVAGAHVADWPFSYEELEPFYEQAEQIIGVSGDSKRNPFEPRRKPFPLGPIAVHPAAEMIDDACRRLGLSAFPTPRAILSAPYRGRAVCSYCGFCGSYGCEIGAKSSSTVTFLAEARASKRLTLKSEAMVLRVTRDARGRARGVVYRDPTGEHEATARVVVVAASAIQSARLLLVSELANQSGLVGRNLLFSTVSAGQGTFRLPHPRFAATGRDWPFIDRSVQDFYRVPGLPYPQAGTLLFLLPHINPIHAAERVADNGLDQTPAWGRELVSRLRERFLNTRAIEFETFAEFLPHDGCRTSLDAHVKDRFGLPVARTDVAVHPASLAASDFLATRGRQVLEACAAEVKLRDDRRAYLFLQAGTARMGHDPKDSVLDATGQAHDVKNLYVADGSGFPSAGAAPFTLTIMANALRVAAHIIARGQRGEL